MSRAISRDPGSGNRDPDRPPRFADWLLKRVLPAGKRGESIRGDLIEEFHRIPDPGSRILDPGRDAVVLAANAAARPALHGEPLAATVPDLPEEIDDVVRPFR